MGEEVIYIAILISLVIAYLTYVDEHDELEDDAMVISKRKLMEEYLKENWVFHSLQDRQRIMTVLIGWHVVAADDMDMELCEELSFLYDIARVRSE